MLGDRTDNVAFRKHADSNIAFGPANIFDDQRTDVFGAQQTRGSGDGFVHTHGGDARTFAMQDVSDFHHNLPDWSRSHSDGLRLVYIIPIVNRVFENSPRGMPENSPLPG